MIHIWLFYTINAYQAEQSMSNSRYLELYQKEKLSFQNRLDTHCHLYYFWIQSVKDLTGRLMSNKYAFSNPPAGIKMVSSQNEYGSKYELSELLIKQLLGGNECSFKWKYSDHFPMHGYKILTKNLARQNSSISYFLYHCYKRIFENQKKMFTIQICTIHPLMNITTNIKKIWFILLNTEFMNEWNNWLYNSAFVISCFYNAQRNRKNWF